MLEHRRNQGLAFKGLYRCHGWTRAQTAKFLHVTERTLHNWENGSVALPPMALKLLRVTFRYELPSPAWSGWVFHSGRLWTPEGHGLYPHEGAYWSLLVRRAETATEHYRELQRLRQILAAGSARVLAGRGQARESASAVGECPALAQDAPADAARSAVDLYNGHIRTLQGGNPAFMRLAAGMDTINFGQWRMTMKGTGA